MEVCGQALLTLGIRRATSAATILRLLPPALNSFRQQPLPSASSSPSSCLYLASLPLNLGKPFLSNKLRWLTKQNFIRKGGLPPGQSHPPLPTARALFTGIVEEMGKVQKLYQVESGGWEMLIAAKDVLEDVKLGDSIAVNGTCLTVTTFNDSSFVVGLSPETLRKTSLGEVNPGSKVNLERSLRPDSRMGGHFVQGHVDGTGIVTRFEPEGDSLWVTVQTSPELLRYIVPKGYVAVDGTSLTVVDVLDEESSFTFMLVAYTQQKVVIPLKKKGDKVNLEVDIVGKYVEKMMQGYAARNLASA